MGVWLRFAWRQHDLHHMIYNMWLSGPFAFGVGAPLPPRIDVETLQVQAYAAEEE